MFIQGSSEGKEGRASLFRVLAVYAMYNPDVSYCQGIQLKCFRYMSGFLFQSIKKLFSLDFKTVI